MNGYLLPIQSNKIASAWHCDKCEVKISHCEIQENICLLEAKIKEWTLRNENWSELVEKLKDELHSNHYLIFGLKKKFISKVQ